MATTSVSRAAVILMTAVRVRCVKLKPKTGGEYREFYQKFMGWEPRISFHLLGNLFYRQPYFQHIDGVRGRHELGRRRNFTSASSFNGSCVHLFFYTAVCVWGSASNYEGEKLWAILAKVSVGLGVLFRGLEILQTLDEIPVLSLIAS